MPGKFVSGHSHGTCPAMKNGPPASDQQNYKGLVQRRFGPTLNKESKKVDVVRMPKTKNVEVVQVPNSMKADDAQVPLTTANIPPS